jgi:hypothetical protein
MSNKKYDLSAAFEKDAAWMPFCDIHNLDGDGIMSHCQLFGMDNLGFADCDCEHCRDNAIMVNTVVRMEKGLESRDTLLA